MKIKGFSAAVIAAVAIPPAFAQTAPVDGQMKLQPITRAAMVQKVQEHFARLDTNQDGFISKEESEAAGKGMRVKIRKHFETRGEEMFDRLDSNNDGMISREEFEARHKVMADRAGLRPAMMAHRLHGGMMGRMFLNADTDSDGRVSLQEATDAALAHFDKADLNGDGVLTPDEMRAGQKVIMIKGSEQR